MVSKDYQQVHDILEQLCNDYAYAVHQPHARNGGLIGLAAAAIALGPVSDRTFHVNHRSICPDVLPYAHVLHPPASSTVCVTRIQDNDRQYCHISMVDNTFENDLKPEGH